MAKEVYREGMLRKNITINSDDFYIVDRFAKKIGISFSELVRKAAVKYVKEQEELDLSAFLRAHCSTVPEDEEYEIVEAMKNKDKKDKGKEIKIEDLL